MKSTEYEMVVAQIAASVARYAEGLPENATNTGKKNRWLGASGISHQIDVSIEGAERILLVECKCWNKRVPLEHVLTFYGRLEDIRPTTQKKPVEGIIVSRIGFQRGAKKVATHFGIHWDVIESTEVFGFKFGPHIVVSPKGATFSPSAGSEVIAKVDGLPPSRGKPAD